MGGSAHDPMLLGDSSPVHIGRDRAVIPVKGRESRALRGLPLLGLKEHVTCLHAETSAVAHVGMLKPASAQPSRAHADVQQVHWELPTRPGVQLAGLTASET